MVSVAEHRVEHEKARKWVKAVSTRTFSSMQSERRLPALRVTCSNDLRETVREEEEEMIAGISGDEMASDRARSVEAARCHSLRCNVDRDSGSTRIAATIALSEMPTRDLEFLVLNGFMHASGHFLTARVFLYGLWHVGRSGART